MIRSNGIFFNKIYRWKAFLQLGVLGRLAHTFRQKKGLRQGGPLSRILFNIVVDMLDIIIERAKENGLLHGVEPRHFICLAIYKCHNTFLRPWYSTWSYCYVFWEIMGSKGNFNKSEIFYFGQAINYEMQYSHLFGCNLGTYPFRYLVVPMYYRNNSNKDWIVTEKRIEKRLASWKRKLLSLGWRLVLIA